MWLKWHDESRENLEAYFIVPGKSSDSDYMPWTVNWIISVCVSVYNEFSEIIEQFAFDFNIPREE